LPNRWAIVRSIVGLARDLNIEVVAEGVETSEQFDLLRQSNCNEVQGYFLGRPMPAGAALALVERRRRLSVRAA
jgi:EAL domain-containing protein (putative c-di-GMP-specific phosphodiesterase class I)